MTTTSTGTLKAQAKPNSNGSGSSTYFAYALKEPNQGLVVKCEVANQKIDDLPADIRYSTDFCHSDHYSVCYSLFPSIGTYSIGEQGVGLEGGLEVTNHEGLRDTIQSDSID